MDVCSSGLAMRLQAFRGVTYVMVENQEIALYRNEITVSKTYDACVSITFSF